MKKAWRFQVKNKNWYLRYGEPEVITYEYDHGTTMYFHFENWCRRPVDSFTLECICT